MRRKLPDQAAALACKEPSGRHNRMMFPTDELWAPARGGAGTGLTPGYLGSRYPEPLPAFRQRSLRLCPHGGPPALGSGGGGTALDPRQHDASAGPGSSGAAPGGPRGSWRPAPHLGRRNRTPPARPPQPPKRTSKPRTLLLYRPAPGEGRRAAATRRPPAPGSSRSCRAAREARTPGPPWCSRCCSTGTPGRSPGCWAAKTLRVRGREKKTRVPETSRGPDQRRLTQICPLREEGRAVPSCMLRCCLPPPGKGNSRRNDGRKTTSGLGAVSPHPTRKLPAYRPKALRRAAQGWGQILRNLKLMQC